MKRKNNKKLALLLILVLVISVGYAALASNLKINGSSNVKASSWNVYWDNVQIKDGSVPADNNNKARITDSAKTQVEFNVVLSEPGDFYEFTVDAVNNGTIDAMIAANGIVDGVYSDSSYTTPATLPDAVSYTVTYADGTEIQDKHLLAKKNGSTPTKETYKVRIEYRNDDEIDPDDLDNDNDHTYYFKFSVNYVQADGAIDRTTGGSEQADSYSMAAMCPGCIFANEGDQYLNQTLTLQTKENYNDLNDSDGMFLGLIVENNTVKRGFVCGTDEDVLFCLEGGVDESESDDKPIYRKNIDILNHFYPNCDSTYDSSEVYCGIAAVYDDGRIELGDQYVYIHDNYAYCAY